MGMDTMGMDTIGGSSSRSGAGKLPWIRKSLSGLYSPGAKREESMRRLILDPESFKRVGEGYERMARPEFVTDLYSDPAVLKYLETTQAQNQLGLGESWANLRSRFAQGGHTQTAGSGPLLQAQAGAAEDAQTALNAIQSTALMGELGRREGLNLGALGALQNYQLTIPQLTAMLAPLLRKSKSTSTPGTLNAYSSAVGAGLGAFERACWVAREVFGEADPRWKQFREWLIWGNRPDFLFSAYMKYGERFARWLRNKPNMKRIVRFFMNKVVKHG
jgi:hypothetical protein